ncbi:kinase-like protein [Trichoderma velutinum]
MSRLSDLVHDTRLNTSIQGDFIVHHHDDSDDENNARSTWRSEYWKTTVLLGHGGCGDVWLQECAQGKRACNKRAVKVIPRLKDKKDSYMTELEAIAKFSQKRYSKCFVKLLGWYDTDSSLCIAMEYFPSGDLQNYMSKTGPMDEANTREISFQVLEGLSYMHQEGFAHRDIKPANILIRAQPPKSKWWVKISDFGISKRVEGPKQVMTSAKGTIPYMAPELLSYEPSRLTLINYEAADMWALGEMTYRMLTQTAAFPTLNALQAYLVYVDSFPTESLSQKNSSADATSFIRSLMNPQPEKRLTSEKAMEHVWVASLKDHRAHVSKSSAPTPLYASYIQFYSMCVLTSSRDPSSSNQQPASTLNPDPWATVSTNGSDGLLIPDYQASTAVPETINNSSLETFSPLESSEIIEMKDSSDANNTAGDSIAKPLSGISDVGSDTHRFDIASDTNDIPSCLINLDMSLLDIESKPRTPPFDYIPELEGMDSEDKDSTKEDIQKLETLYTSGDEATHQGEQTNRPHPQILTEHPTSVQAASCAQCQTSFSFVNEEYLCPICGRFFDSKCSSKMTPIDNMGTGMPDLVRVDDECFAMINGVAPKDKYPENRKSQRQSKAPEANQGKTASVPVEELFDLRPHLREMKRDLVGKYETIRDGRARDDGWREKRDRQEARNAEWAKVQPEDPIARERRLREEELVKGELLRLINVLDIDWPTEPSSAEFYFYPNTYEKAYGKYLREVEHHLERMRKQIKREEELRAKRADTRSAGRKLLGFFGYAAREKKE